MNIYEIEVRARCPHDEKLIDVYEVTLTTEAVLMAEAIVEWFKQYETKQVLQEDLTRETAVGLGCRVRTVGMHGRVKITSVAP